MKIQSAVALGSAVIGTAMAVTLLLVQSAPAQAPTPPAPMPAATSTTTVPPLPGANSFTETQVATRLTDAGYANATGLKKDDQGIWRGKATKGGQQVSVAVDFKGTIVETK